MPIFCKYYPTVPTNQQDTLEPEPVLSGQLKCFPIMPSLSQNILSGFICALKILALDQIDHISQFMHRHCLSLRGSSGENSSSYEMRSLCDSISQELYSETEASLAEQQERMSRTPSPTHIHPNQSARK